MHPARSAKSVLLAASALPKADSCCSASSTFCRRLLLAVQDTWTAQQDTANQPAADWMVCTLHTGSPRHNQAYKLGWLTVGNERLQPSS